MTEKVQGSDMVEWLAALSPGETVLVSGREWCSLDDWKFEVTENGEARVLGREEAEALFDPDTTYEVTR